MQRKGALRMLITYPALFYYDPNETTKYYIYFPDFGLSDIRGKDVTDAMKMAADWLGITAAEYLDNGHELPHPSPLIKVSLGKNNPFNDDPDINLTYDRKHSFTSMVFVDLTDYLNNSQPVKKTLIIPKWADMLGKKKKVNFSKLLTKAISDAPKQ